MMGLHLLPVPLYRFSLKGVKDSSWELSMIKLPVFFIMNSSVRQKLMTKCLAPEKELNKSLHTKLHILKQQNLCFLNPREPHNLSLSHMFRSVRRGNGIQI